MDSPWHTGSIMQALIAQLLTEKARDVRTFRDTVPAYVAITLERALSKVPADRFESAAEFARMLREPGAATVRVASTVLEKRKSLWWPIATAVAFIVALAAWFVPHPGRNATNASWRLQRQLTFEGNLRGAAISRDGAWLAYVTTDCDEQVVSCNSELKLREVDGTQSVLMLEWPSILPDVKWTVDGSSIVFRGTSTSDDSTGLFAVSQKS